MPIISYLDHSPQIGAEVTLAIDAFAIGKVHILGPALLESSSVIRGDQNDIRIGRRFRLGPRSTVHLDRDSQTRIGTDVWIGANAVVHGATLGDGVRVEDHALVLSRSTIGAGSVVASGSLVPEGASFPENSFISGTPARRQRDTTPDERAETIAQLVALGFLDPSLARDG